MPDGGEIYRLGERIARAVVRRTERSSAGWLAVLRQVAVEIGRDHVSMMAAAVAFYALLSIFPGLSALISLYGLVADPSGVGALLSSLGWVLPREADYCRISLWRSSPPRRQSWVWRCLPASRSACGAP